MIAFRYGSNTALTLQDTSFWTGFSWITLSEITISIVTIVGLASFYKIVQLRAGGSAVAELLGGHLLDRNSTSLDERKVLNVVEEMAIASGVPVPPVYLIEDAAINAFAAGHDTRDVAIGITRGCIQILDRDELQGVVAHEFSHIFNGDMKINLRLIGILHGILFIGLIGRMLLDSMNTRSSFRRNSRGLGPLIFLGIALVAIGYCGTFFGNLIKAAISRQREFLADASAVQFTRNPTGIGNALKKIGGYSLGSRIRHPRANEISHLFFGDGLKHVAWSLFATHPPLEDRILAVQPEWQGDYPNVTLPPAVTQTVIDPDSVQIIDGEVFYQRTATASPAASNVGNHAMLTALSAIGSPDTTHIAQARETLGFLPDNLQRLSRETYGARAVVHCLLLDPLHEQRQKQLQLLSQTAEGSVFTLCEKIMPQVDGLPIALRLPLIDLCLPSLKLLSGSQHTEFMKAVMAQIQADAHVSLFEWALYSLLRHHLNHARRQNGKQLPLESVADSCQIILSALACATHNAEEDIQQAFIISWESLSLPTTTLSRDVLDNLANLDNAVRALSSLQVLSKPRFLKACCKAIEKNGEYETASVELLRAIADTIDAPIPPVIHNAVAP